MCVNFSPSIYGNSSLETSCGLALSLSSVCDSRRMGQKYCPSIESCPLNTIFFSQFRMQWAACHCWGIIFSLCLHLCPCFWPEQCGGGDTYSSRLDTACTAFHLQQPSLPIRIAGSQPTSAGFVIILGEANFTLSTLLRRFVQVLNGLIIVAGCSLPSLLLCSSVWLSSLCWGGVFKTGARCNLVFPVVGNADVSKWGGFFSLRTSLNVLKFPVECFFPWDV